MKLRSHAVRRRLWRAAARRVSVGVAGAVGLALAAAPAGLAQNGAQDAPTITTTDEGRFHIETLAEGLELPWSIAVLPDGSVLVTEKQVGRLRRIDADGLRETPIAGVPDDLFTLGQGGLLDVVAHPDFENNGLIYLSYTWGELSANAVRVARGRLEGDTLHDVEVLFTSGPPKDTSIQFGGRLAFLPDGTFILTLGEGFVWREDSQRLTTHLGKVIRLNDDGSIPADNPYRDVEDALPEIWTIGHRNPQGLAVDPVTGTIYESEHGPWGGDELNTLASEHNYGWPVATHGLDYNGAPISPFTTYPGMDDPVVYWTPSIATSGLAVYRGDLFPEWNGDVLAGGMQALAVARVDMDAPGGPREAERLFEDLSARVRDVRVGPDGAIYLLAEAQRDGKVLRVTPAD